MMLPTLMADTRRDTSNLSATAETTTSMMEISEVTPARKSEPKKRMPKRPPKGMRLIMVGKAMNARPIPEEATSSTATPCWADM